MRRVRVLVTALVLLGLGVASVGAQSPNTLTRLSQRNKWLGQPATAQNVVPGTAGLLVGNTVLTLAQATAYNRGSGAVAGGVVALLADGQWHAGAWTNATTTYTADTADCQSAATNDCALETTTVNDGVVIGATVPFGAVSVDVTTAGSGTTPTHVVEYWDGAAWTAIAAVGMLVDVPRSADWGAGESLLLFEPPGNWTLGGSGTNVPSGHYNLRVRRTNATQATAALARRLYVGRLLASSESLTATTGSVSLPAGSGPLTFDKLVVTALHAVFATADEGNAAEFFWRLRP